MANNELHRFGTVPELRNPVLIAGFGGWNDAGEIATFAVETLVSSWGATRFAEIDPENFFDFSETRPMVSLGPTGQRSLQWPANVFYSHPLPDHDRDIVLLAGTEPNLRWRSFCRLIVSLAAELDVSCLITLGGLLADVPHTREPTLTGFTSTKRLLPQLQQLGVHLSSYEGPTGIVGALSDAWRATRKPSISLWGNVPHYITASPNPQVALALLRRIAILLGTTLPLASIETQAYDFGIRVNEALQSNPEAMEYVHQLEEDQGEEEDDNELTDVPSPEETPQLIEALEEFLRAKRPVDDGDGE